MRKFNIISLAPPPSALASTSGRQNVQFNAHEVCQKLEEQERQGWTVIGVFNVAQLPMALLAAPTVKVDDENQDNA